MKETQIYDYIIVGAGAAGLMLANAMALDPFFSDKRILILDKDPKEANDRTWCFWEKNEGPLEALICRDWSLIGVSENDQLAPSPILPYKYKMLKGATFYEAMKKGLAHSPNCHFLLEEVKDISPVSAAASVSTETAGFLKNGHTKVTTTSGTYIAPRVFNSIFDYKPLLAQNRFPVLQQHFVGWFVRTQNPVFKPEMATFMDFRVAQKGNTRFMYVLPTSTTTALVEYTLFSKDRLKKEVYEAAIVAYLEEIKAGDYEINDTEAGSIPMTCYPFEQFNTPHLLHIGTAGGWSKPSTGFTFSNTQKQIPKLVAYLKKGKPLDQFPSKDRFWWYDHILLEVLASDNSRGKAIFEGLFKRRSAPLILKFLSQETHFFQELYIMSAADKWRFTKAFFRVLGRSFN